MMSFELRIVIAVLALVPLFTTAITIFADLGITAWTLYGATYDILQQYPEVNWGQLSYSGRIALP